MHYQVVSRTSTFEARLSDKLLFADSTVFRALLGEVKASQCKSCVLDVKDLTVIDSAGLGMLMIAVDDAKRAGWTLTLINAQGAVLKLLQLSRMDQLLKVA